mmetsp:Transcript_21189/g.58140  ORF Transcript_21189/g.58140 Transcript_21189/m.58140 type:complete len:98 (+) Transcript_21189:316-609(+)
MIGWGDTQKEGKVAVRANVLGHEIAVLRKDIENIEEGQDPYFFEEVRAALDTAHPRACLLAPTQTHMSSTGLFCGGLYRVAGLGGFVGSHRITRQRA